MSGKWVIHPYCEVDFATQKEISKVSNIPCPYPARKYLNRLRIGMDVVHKINMIKWKVSNEENWESGSIQTIPHVLFCPKLPTTCTHLGKTIMNYIQLASSVIWTGTQHS
uniref:Uncharacterized protein n=1 Tax=Cacopsylla melanoneura TaxID=428564 RepID=A0A8D8LHR1_9HEMI